MFAQFFSEVLNVYTTLLSVFKHALMISFFVFVMMLLVDFIDNATKRKMSRIMQGDRWRQYTLASFLGSTPGCLGAFMDVTFYVHGMISFGAIVGGMIATSGDEAFVMLTEFPGPALLLFGLLFVFGVLFAWVSDKIYPIFGIIPCQPCVQSRCEQCLNETDHENKPGEVFRRGNVVGNLRALSVRRAALLLAIAAFLVLVTSGIVGPGNWNWKRVTFMGLSLCSLYIVAVASEHYLISHVWDHIVRKHLLRVLLWTFGALLFLEVGSAVLNLNDLVRGHMMWVLLIGALIGVIPESGPHLVFVMMYAHGLVPFSVLFTSSFVQDGHGMLPLLSYSFKDTVLIKAFNLAFGIAVGMVLFAMGF